MAIQIDKKVIDFNIKNSLIGIQPNHTIAGLGEKLGVGVGVGMGVGV